MLPTKLQVNWPFGSWKKRKKDFQDGRHGSHLGFPIGTILAIFDLQASYQVSSQTDLLVQENSHTKKRKMGCRQPIVAACHFYPNQ